MERIEEIQGFQDARVLAQQKFRQDGRKATQTLMLLIQLESLMFLRVHVNRAEPLPLPVVPLADEFEQNVGISNVMDGFMVHIEF